MTAVSAIPSFSIRARRDSAWPRVRGNPSRINPPPQRRHPARSFTICQTVESGTSSPRRINSRASFMAGLGSHSARAAARKTSPVDRWQAPSRWVKSSACVPFPTPGAPSRTSLHRASGEPDLLSHGTDGPCSHALRLLLSGLIPLHISAGEWARSDRNHIWHNFDRASHLRVSFDHLLGVFAGGFGELGAAEHAGHFLGAILACN